ncbi:CPBP family intramembrane glutamic endopeptidase [Manganibacter manganicus]|uniref:Abortive phage infection protein n=1 Tax=Manganibacter manganicus TaxID=1873176 RepID=A0A1V8RVG9_9HYPH|nr:CPBP family intramembrane glutamic endopeptidase [Pseudaminobacter manganicus]OQM77201.1 abortive phage infection protein [Pseudaminobacter manganicus]
MKIDAAAFENYRKALPGRSGLPRLLTGTAVIVAFWAVATVAVLFGGVYAVSSRWVPDDWVLAGGGRPQDIHTFIASPVGILTALLSFAGIWVGTWIVMRGLYRTPLDVLFGNGRRIAWTGFFKGLAAVFITSLFSELLFYAMEPEIERGTIDFSVWVAMLVPVAALVLLQTSAEELLFRGYLTRGLAARCRNPLVWGLLPLLAFAVLHWSPSSSLAINASVILSIAAFALVLTLTVYATGNLGAAFGAHLGNNLFGFLLISHQENYNAFALFSARPLESAGWSLSDAVVISGIGLASCLLTALLLLHPRSPLRLTPDRGRQDCRAPDEVISSSAAA